MNTANSKPTRRRKSKYSSRRPKQKPKADGQPYYAVKNIIGEKLEKGQLWYRVDWEDDPHTDQRFDPTWEPAENLTEEAIDSWEEDKRLAVAGANHTSSPSAAPPPSGTQLSGTATTDSQPVLPPNWRAQRSKRLREGLDSEAGSKGVSYPRKRRQVEQAHLGLALGSDTNSKDNNEDTSWSFVGSLPANRGTLVVGVPAQPRFNPTEYEPVTLSSSQRANSPATPQEQEAVSQRTIPDSQDFSESVPSNQVAVTWPDKERTSVDLVEVPATSTTSQQPPEGTPESGPTQDRSEPSGQAIPSHQPDVFHNDAPPSQSALETSHPVLADTNFGPVSLPPSEFIGDTASQDIDYSDQSPPGAFLSQPDFGLEIPSLEASLPKSPGRPANHLASSGDVSGESPNIVSAISRSVISDTSPHSAQAVRPLSSHPRGIRTQSQDDISVYENENQQRASVESLQPEESDQHSEELTGDSPAPSPEPLLYERVPSAAQETDRGSPQNVEDIGSPLAESQTSSSHHPHISSQAIQPARDFRISPQPRSFTASPVDMDGSPLSSGSRLSAVEKFRRLQAEIYGQAQAQSPESSSTSPEVRTDPSALSPSSAMPPQQIMAANAAGASSQRREIARTGDSTASQSTGLTASTGDILDRLASATAALSAPAPPAAPPSVEGGVLPETTTQPVPDGRPSEELADAVLPGIESQESPAEMDMEPDSLVSDVVRPVTAGTNGYVVTLPMLASTRAQYLEAIRSSKITMVKYGNCFSADSAEVPDDALVSEMDALFKQLVDLCDMPAFAGSLPDMPLEAKKKHATGTNSKFSFVYELLDQIQESSTRVLLIARPDRVLEYLEAVVATSGFRYRYLGQEADTEESSDGLDVTIAGSDQDLSGIGTGFDVIILFDSAARSSVELPRHLFQGGLEGPVILSLVVTCSIEHIDLRLSDDMDPLERKNAMNFALVASKEIIRDPARSGFQEPHQLAVQFADFVTDPSGELDWEPQSIPDALFDFYRSSQIQPEESLQDSGGRVADSARSNSRKRLMDDVEEGTPKRARVAVTQEPMANRTPPVISDLLKQTLAIRDSSGKTSGPNVEIPVQRLESMAAEIAALSTQLQDKAAVEAKLSDHVVSLEVQLKSNEKSIRDMQPKYMDALRDRGIYEQERNNALAEAKKLTALLEASKAATASAKEQNDVLESRLDAATALLGDSPNPDIAQFSSAWKDLRDAKAKVDSLEKKLATAQKDMDYSRDAYQRASTSASELSIENGELKGRIKELEKMAGDNITKIQQIQARNESLEYLRELDELKAIVKDRERELDRLREDVRQLRSGRRDTRYASVPRSPRIGVMSPRVNRSAGGGATSRGTSPTSLGGYDAGVASGMPLFGQEPGNGRWGHLRD